MFHSHSCQPPDFGSPGGKQLINSLPDIYTLSFSKLAGIVFIFHALYINLFSWNLSSLASVGEVEEDLELIEELSNQVSFVPHFIHKRYNLLSHVWLLILAKLREL